MTKQELQELLREMSLKEKVDQMLQLSGFLYAPDGGGVLTGPVHDMGLAAEDLALAGSILGTNGAKFLKDFQDAYMAGQPHHIPMLFMMDVIHGMKTVFPMPLGLGATFEPEAAKRCAEIAAKEASVSGLHVVFSPMVDLVRDARWGRVMESTGEDPYLNSLFAAAQVEGFQGGDPGEPYRVASCVKHFAAYGGAEAGRDYNTVELTEPTLRNSYLRSYQAAVEAGAAMVMTSFNTVNGIPATTNRHLMRDILRDEMGFRGVLISDFAAIQETIAHGYSEDDADAAAKALTAGVDIDMMTGVYAANLCRLVEEGKVDAALIDEAVMRILELKNRLGLFENPYKDADEEKEKAFILCPEHRALALETAEKSLVLLKNDGMLPLDLTKKIAFIGPYTECRNLLSSWAVAGDPKDCATIREAAEKFFDPARTSYHTGCAMLGPDVELLAFAGPTRLDNLSAKEYAAMEREALAAAAEAELVVMPLGESYLQSGEAASRAQIDVPEVQMELFRKVCAVNPNVAVVLFNGRPLDIREISAKARAVLVAWFPGTEGAAAVVNALTGAYNPSGRLPVSFPYCVGQVPVYYNHFSTGRPDPKGTKEKFKSKYTDIPNEPLYPFGYGLGYTTFAYSPVQLSGDTLTPGEELTASVTVTNTGDRTGVETVQLYLQDRFGSVVRPVKELKGIRKVELAPGEKAEVTFPVTEEMLRFWRADGSFGSEAGAFVVYIGGDSTVEDGAEFTLCK